eukprot:scpid82207/ scgid7851/ 
MQVQTAAFMCHRIYKCTTLVLCAEAAVTAGKGRGNAGNRLPWREGSDGASKKQQPPRQKHVTAAASIEAHTGQKKKVAISCGTVTHFSSSTRSGCDGGQ